MDKFEQAMQQMAKMSKEEMNAWVESSKKVCICPGCPTYNDCARDAKELLYCALGKSMNCMVRGVTCICPDCPVTEQLDLRYNFYCLRGTEKTLRGL